MPRQSRPDRTAADLRARELRRSMANIEWRMWNALRGRQRKGFKFRRQVPIGPYFADFACMEGRLVVEVDGDQHRAERDARRDALVAELGFRTLRFSAQELDENIDVVVEAIDEALAELPPPTSPRAAGRGIDW